LTDFLQDEVYQEYLFARYQQKALSLSPQQQSSLRGQWEPGNEMEASSHQEEDTHVLPFKKPEAAQDG
jgi:hypothetical protein